MVPFLLEECSCDAELLFCSQFQEESPVIIAISQTLPSYHSFPCFSVSIKNNDVISCSDAPQDLAEFGVEYVFVHRDCLNGWAYMLMSVACYLSESGRRMDIFEFGSNGVFFIMKPTPERRLSCSSFPEPATLLQTACVQETNLTEYGDVDVHPCQFARKMCEASLEPVSSCSI